MTKSQVLFYGNEKFEYEGWRFHPMLLDLWEDDEDIPQDMVDLICYPPERDFHPYVMIMGKGLMEQIDMVSTQYLLLEQAKDNMTEN